MQPQGGADIDRCLNFLKYGGLWRVERHQSLYFIYSGVVVFTLVQLLVTQIGLIPLPHRDVDHLATNVYLVVEFTSVLCKISPFLVLRKSVYDLVDLLDDETMRHDDGTDISVSIILENSKAHAGKIFRNFHGVGRVTIVMWFLVPLINNFVPIAEICVTTGNATLCERIILPLDAWYPFDPTQGLVYYIVYLYQVTAVFFAYVGMVGVDIFYVTVMIFITAQLEILNNVIVNLRRNAELRVSERRSHARSKDSLTGPMEDNYDFDGIYYNASSCKLGTMMGRHESIQFYENLANHEQLEKEIQLEIHQTLIKSVIHHQNLSRCVEKLQTVMNPSAIGQFLTNMVTLCIAALLLTLESSDGGNKYKFAFNLVFSTLENLLYCWYGNQIIEQSERLGFSLYSCVWPESNEEFKATLQIFMLRCQKPLKITVGKLYTISRETFRQLMNGSYSLFAVLHQINSS